MSLIRPLLISECAEIAAWMVQMPLWQRYRLTETSICSSFAQALQRGETLLAAENKSGQVCGFAWCILNGAFGRSAYLRLIGVHPQMSGQGLGKMLLQAVEDAARQAGQDLFLLVSDFNVDAQRFYQRAGYQQAGTIPGYVLEDVAELIYWKRLATSH